MRWRENLEAVVLQSSHTQGQLTGLLLPLLLLLPGGAVTGTPGS